MAPQDIAFGLAVLLLAGTIKGLVGLGLPTITIALTSLAMPLTEAIALVALPTIFTNIWQAAVGGHFWAIVRRQWLLMLPLAVCLYLTMWLPRPERAERGVFGGGGGGGLFSGVGVV